MPGCPSGCLNQAGIIPKKSLFVSIKNADQRNLRQVETFTKKIDSNKNVEFGSAKSSQNFNPFNRIHVGMNVANFELHALKILRQILGSLFSQCRYKNALTLFNPLSAKFDSFIDLIFERPESKNRIEKSGRANHLLNNQLLASQADIKIFNRLQRTAWFDT